MAGPNTWNELIQDINTILDNFALSVGEDVVSSNVIGATDFTKATGTYINSPQDPWTSSTIPLGLTGAVRGGISMIWYRGPALTKANFTGGTITMFSGENVNLELCRLCIDYDKNSDAFSVNIQTGFTGDIPSNPVDPAAPAKMTITAIYNTSGDTTPPAKMGITSVVGDVISPSKMIITSVT